ncbi:iron ABC transporter permease [Kibdelosporangium persicum]|uniref:Ferric hydroxamate ABC transporter permease component n=1 Tax=Kibdelosporangium persicum TaxID=2698649 RepID=A0ABX2EWG7_9PSEU|nr:iron ABC transporter permease [Kibdelosporangium persicum]NRN63155.1 Ferric hydroxamate ABC transporter permease component [Kibdelosporangium persicum]
MPKLITGGVAVVLCAVIVVHLGLGAAGVGVLDVLSFVAGNGDENTRNVLWGSRIPRTLAGLVVGIALGVSGALIQGATRNPLAAPDTLGVNAGAYFAVAALAFAGVNAGVFGNGGVAFLGGLAAVALVYLLTVGGVLTPGRVLLAGATVSLIGMAGAEFLQILDEHQTRGLFFWGNGSLMQTGLDRPLVVGAVVLAGAALAPLLARSLDLLSLGDETAQAMGVQVNRVRPMALSLAVVLAAAAVTVAGPIGFVGLIAPVAVRLLGIHGHSLLIPLAGLTAATLVLAADAAAQVALPPSAGYGELPVGIVTALIGGPIFIVLARRVITGDADRGAAVVVAQARKSRFVTALVIGCGLLAVAAVVGLRVGDMDISWSDLASVVTGSGQEMANAVVSFRLPRILVAAGAGACLAIAGVAVQSVVRNPLAEPGLMGITGGASAAAMLVILVIPSAPVAVLPVAATAGGVLAMVIIVLIARQLDPTRVVLIGLGMAATTMALVNVMVVGAQMNITAALTWLAGSTYARDLSTLGWLLLPAVVAVMLIVGGRAVNMLALGDDLPRSLGLALGRTRMLVLCGGALLAAGTAAAVGTVGFVGLVAPHLARRIVGTATHRLMPMAAVLGAVLVVVADTVGRSVLAPTEIPVGIVTALLGTPYLVWLLRAK